MRTNSNFTANVKLGGGGYATQFKVKLQRIAFTLVELLVVIAIIGILIALLLPAVQAAREAARRMQCTNNLKQIVLASHNYHDVHNLLVPAGFCLDGNGHFPSWYQRILPYVEQQSLYDMFLALDPQNFWVTNAYIPSITSDEINPYLKTSNNFACPSFGQLTAKRYSEIVDSRACYGCYSVNLGPVNYFGSQNGWPDAPTINQWRFAKGRPFMPGYNYSNPGGFENIPSNVNKMFVTMATVTDGLSNTVFFSEVTPPKVDITETGGADSGNGPDTSYSDFQIVAGCGFTGLYTPNSIGPDYCRRGWQDGMVGRNGLATSTRAGEVYWQSHTARSYHPGGVNAALGDGSVRFVSDTVAISVWDYSLIGSDGAVVALP